MRGHWGDAKGLTFHPSGEVIASTGLDGTVRIWEAATGRQLHVLRCSFRLTAVAFRSGGCEVGAIAQDGTLLIWDYETGVEHRRLMADARGALGLAFSPDGRWLAVAGWSAATIFDLDNDGQRVVERRGAAHNVCFSPDGKHLAIGRSDRTIHLIECPSGREIFVLKGHALGVTDVAFSPDGQRLASASYDQKVRLWDTVTGQTLLTLPAHDGLAYGVAFCPDGGRLLSCGGDRLVRIWGAWGR